MKRAGYKEKANDRGPDRGWAAREGKASLWRWLFI